MGYIVFFMIIALAGAFSAGWLFSFPVELLTETQFGQWYEDGILHERPRMLAGSMLLFVLVGACVVVIIPILKTRDYLSKKKRVRSVQA